MINALAYLILFLIDVFLSYALFQSNSPTGGIATITILMVVVNTIAAFGIALHGDRVPQTITDDEMWEEVDAQNIKIMDDDEKKA